RLRAPEEIDQDRDLERAIRDTLVALGFHWGLLLKKRSSMRRSEIAQARMAGAPVTTSGMRLTIPRASACGPSTPNRPAASISAPSCTPRPPGTTNAALRAVAARVSITSAAIQDTPQ